MSEKTHVNHEFGPFFDEESEILVLGSFPSVLSRKQGFYYGNPRNRFWMILQEVFGEPVPNDVEGRKNFCKRHHIALYDAIEECDIVGSKDDSIENIVPADVQSIVLGSKIKRIVLNGNAAKHYFLTFQPNFDHVELFFMPSTSPANAAWSLPRLVEIWKSALNNC